MITQVTQQRCKITVILWGILALSNRMKYPMKLSEALMIRADYQKRLGQLKQRILNNAKVQEGDELAEAIPTLLAQVRVG